MRPPLRPLAAGFILLTGNLSAQESLKSARNALAESLPDVAATRVERYLSTQSDLTPAQKAEASLLLAEAQLRSGEPAKALAALRKVPDDFASERNYWQGIALAHQHNYGPALEKLAKVSSEHPSYSQALFNQVELHFGQNDEAKAFEKLKQLREHEPDFQKNELSLLEAQLYLAIDEPANALNALKKAEAKDKPSPASDLLRGRIALAKKDFATALNAFETAQNSTNLKTLSLLGKSDTLLQGENPDSALEPLLILLKEPNAASSLDLLHARFETLLVRAPDNDAITAALTSFATPATLGEDGNLATPPKLFSCYYLARFSEREEAKKLFSQILSLQPESEIAARACLQLAGLALDDEQAEEAKKYLADISKAVPDSPLASKAANILARLAVANGDLTEAQQLFAEAAQHPDSSFREQALLNQAILKLSTDPDAPLSALSTKLDSSEAKSALELERALSLAKSNSPAAREALQEFLHRHPSHPRMGDARLALANALLSEPQPDFKLIEAQLISLPEKLTRKLSRDSFRVAHRLGVVTNDWSTAVTLGEKHRKDFPESENEPYFLLRLAECCFQNGDYNRSRFLFSEIAALPDVGELAELAKLYAARSNLLIPTREASVEAFEILDGIIKRGGPLATRARLLKARDLLKNQGQAEKCLQALDGIPGDPGDQPEAALLSAQAYRELTSENPAAASKAIKIYERLLADPRTSYRLSNEIHYQLALTHRENGDLNLAIEPCMQVVDWENKPKEEKEFEWDFYFRCGFEAIDILLEAKRARAALILARKLAQTGGPGAEQAKERAEQIQLDHQLWTD